MSETKGGGAGGAAEAVGPAAETSAAAKVPAPTVTMVLPKNDGYLGEAPFQIDVRGQPGSSVVVYLTHYFQGKVRHNIHEVVSLDSDGEGTTMGTIPIGKDPGHHSLFARASAQPGVFSELRVREFDSMVDTYGGGV